MISKISWFMILDILLMVHGGPSPVINGNPEPVVQCTFNETITRCPLCERDCSQLYLFDAWSNKNPCPESCSTHAPMCICKPGFFRNPSGDCVIEKECPPPCPWANEVPNYCDQPFEPRCQPSCSNPVNYPNGTIVVLDWLPKESIPEFYCQYGICHTLVCACKKGYVRHDDTWRCIKAEECPAPVTELKPAPRIEDDESARKLKDVTWNQVITEIKSTASTRSLVTSKNKKDPPASNFNRPQEEKTTSAQSLLLESDKQNPIMQKSRVIAVSSINENAGQAPSVKVGEITKESSRNSIAVASEKAGTDGVRFFWLKAN